jgi:hypothetical protein
MTFQHHKPDCAHAGEDAGSGADHFCDCHDFAEPQIGPDGRDIAFPAGWTEIQARQWRERNGLVAPSEPGAGP